MSLMRMLSVSRSFCARVPELGRYRMTGGLRLPRFGSASGRVKALPVATQVELPIAGVAAGGVAGGVTGGGKRKGPGIRERMGWWRNWVSGWRRWLDWVVRPAAPRRPSRRPVQTAFLLESVKVVRNDLADADLELVRTQKRRRAVSGTGKAMTGSPAVGESRPGLGRTAVRWLTAGRMS